MTPIIFLRLAFLPRNLIDPLFLEIPMMKKYFWPLTLSALALAACGKKEEAPAPAARFEAADLASSVQHTTGPPVHVEPVSAATTEGHTEPTPAPCRACLDLLRGVRTTAHFAVADDLPDDRCHPRGGSGLPQLCLQGLLQSTGWVRSASPSRFGAATLCADATEPSHALGRTGVAIAARGGTRAGCVQWATAYLVGGCACRLPFRP